MNAMASHKMAQENKVVHEGPIITEALHVEVADDLFSEENKVSEIGFSNPAFEAVPYYSPDFKKVRLSCKIVVVGITKKGNKQLYRLEYKTRTVLSFARKIEENLLNNPELFSKLADPIYQRMADRVFHIFLDMGIVVQMPMKEGHRVIK